MPGLAGDILNDIFRGEQETLRIVVDFPSKVVLRSPLLACLEHHLLLRRPLLVFSGFNFKLGFTIRGYECVFVQIFVLVIYVDKWLRFFPLFFFI